MSDQFREGAGLRFSHENLIQQINHCMTSLPDSRVGKNTTYEMRDAGKSGKRGQYPFSCDQVFLMCYTCSLSYLQEVI